MAATRSSFLALLAQRCPRCHEGPLYKHSSFNVSKFEEMYEACPVCGLHYEPEPGFYWGAMYISFAFSTGIMLIVGVLLYYLANDPPTWVYVTSVALVTVLMAPLSLRYSRALMLYFFGGVHYDPHYAKESSTLPQ